MKVADWLPKVLVESALIVFSILLALGVNQWKEGRATRNLTEASLLSFEREIEQNQARIEDVFPYHNGMREVLARMEESAALSSPAEFRGMVGPEGFRPPFLLDTAWKTALATGALTHMDYETVSALSMTYSLQERFRESSRASLPELIRTGGLGGGTMEDGLRSTVAYLNDVTAGEAELQAVYEQALALLRARRAEEGERPTEGDTRALPDAFRPPEGP